MTTATKTTTKKATTVTANKTVQANPVTTPGQPTKVTSSQKQFLMDKAYEFGKHGLLAVSMTSQITHCLYPHLDPSSYSNVQAFYRDFLKMANLVE